MRIQILFGTESGNAELVAMDVSDALLEEHDVEAEDLADFDLDFMPATLYLVVCSTHGEGDLPQSAVPFCERAERDRPQLEGVRYAMFGLGDSTYPNYSRGSEHVDRLLTELGATRIGEYGRHDAAGREIASEVAETWAESVIAAVQSVPDPEPQPAT